jgi:hypothetical protein
VAEFGSGFQGVVVFINHDGAVVVTVFSGSLFLTVFGHQVSLALLRKVIYVEFATAFFEPTQL